MKRNFTYLLIFCTVLIAFFQYQNKISFSYNYLENQSLLKSSLTEFEQNKQTLFSVIENSQKFANKQSPEYDDYIHTTQCRRVLDRVDSKGQSIINHKKYYQVIDVQQSAIFKTYNQEQRAVANKFISSCLGLTHNNENFNQMLERYKAAFEEKHKYDKAVGFMRYNSLIKTVADEQRFDRNLISYAKLQIKLPVIKSKDKKKYWKLIRNSKKSIKAINEKYQKSFLELLKTTQDTNILMSIMYNYNTRLPAEWKNRIINSLSNISSTDLNNKINNKYFETLIIPSIDLYLCSRGHPCGKKSEFMRFQCLGLKYLPNKSACNQSVADFYFTDFLTKNMQYDVLKIISLLSVKGGYK